MEADNSTCFKDCKPVYVVCHETLVHLSIAEAQALAEDLLRVVRSVERRQEQTIIEPVSTKRQYNEQSYWDEARGQVVTVGRDADADRIIAYRSYTSDWIEQCHGTSSLMRAMKLPAVPDGFYDEIAKLNAGGNHA